MKVLVHDLNEQDFPHLGTAQNEYTVINAHDSSVPCTGCYQCWLKTPGTCTVNDRFKNAGSVLAQSGETALISRNCYGGYSEQVKNVLDRSISGGLPFFTYRSGKMRHTRRYNVDRKRLTVIFYGDFLESEAKTARLLAEANRSNMDFQELSFYITDNIKEIGEFLQ